MLVIWCLSKSRRFSAILCLSKLRGRRGEGGSSKQIEARGKRGVAGSSGGQGWGVAEGAYPSLYVRCPGKQGGLSKLSIMSNSVFK